MVLTRVLFAHHTYECLAMRGDGSGGSAAAVVTLAGGSACSCCAEDASCSRGEGSRGIGGGAARDDKAGGPLGVASGLRGVSSWGSDHLDATASVDKLAMVWMRTETRDLRPTRRAASVEARHFKKDTRTEGSTVASTEHNRRGAWHRLSAAATRVSAALCASTARATEASLSRDLELAAAPRPPRAWLGSNERGPRLRRRNTGGPPRVRQLPRQRAESRGVASGAQGSREPTTP